jgi:hypothetical protein
MHSTDYASRTRPTHRHDWQYEGNTARCACGARKGLLSLGAYIDLFYPPGTDPAIAQGTPCLPPAPRLAANWRSGK